MSTTTTTFVWRTDEYYEWTVPAQVFTVTMECWGGQSGSESGGGTAGNGGYIKGNVLVTPGEVLRVYVASGGSDIQNSAFNRGGQGGGFGTTNDGGGSSSVRRTPYDLADRLIIAGGGGAGGDEASGAPGTPGAGGNGGYPTGTAGTDATDSARGGAEGTGSSGGAGGSGSGDNGDDGTLGVGGGGGGTGVATSGGGGGGAGYYGGGGGGAGGSNGGGGGGGSSAIPGGTLLDHSTGTRTGNGAVTFTYSESQVLPARTSDTPYILANDRYQTVILCENGTSTTPPEFRYWYAGPPAWDSQLD